MRAQGVPARRKIHIVGGGTIGNHVASHLAIAAPAYGTTAKRIAELCEIFWNGLETHVHLTKFADPTSDLETVNDMQGLAEEIADDYNTKVVFWSPVIADFTGSVEGFEPGKYSGRLSSKGVATLQLSPTEKILHSFRKNGVNSKQPRKDIFLVAFKTTVGLDDIEMYAAGVELAQTASANLVLVNDVRRRRNMVVSPEQAAYHMTNDRDEALLGLVEMAYMRSQLTFTQSTVVDGEPVQWSDERIYPSLRTVVDYCIENGAYKPVMGTTAGHFAAKIGPTTFLTSRRKTNFNNLPSTGLVQVTTDGPDSVVAEGSKPSVGGQSQRIVFEEHEEYDCIVHFHCPIKPGSDVPIVSQREYECGSHECGQNTSRGLSPFGALSAVYLDNHGPNIVFNHAIDPQVVIDFIEDNFDLSKRTGMYEGAIPLAA